MPDCHFDKDHEEHHREITAKEPIAAGKASHSDINIPDRCVAATQT